MVSDSYIDKDSSSKSRFSKKDTSIAACDTSEHYGRHAGRYDLYHPQEIEMISLRRNPIQRFRKLYKKRTNTRQHARVIEPKKMTEQHQASAENARL